MPMGKKGLIPGLYLAPSPSGAYYAVSDAASDQARATLLNMMRQREAKPLDDFWLERFSGDSGGRAVELLTALQDAGYVQGLGQPHGPPPGSVDEVVPRLLTALAMPGGQILLADGHGLALASHGFGDAEAEELAGLSADLAMLHARHRDLLVGKLDIFSSAWAIVGAGGNSEVGFWPLYIESHRFVLVIRGCPNLNRPELVDLVWLLTRRYAAG